MSENETLTTKLQKKWLFKIGIFLVVLFGLGVWGWYDATVIYPKRGKVHVDFMLKNYLEQASASGQLLRASVFDPAAEYQRLLGAGEQLSEVERARLEWLTAVSRLHRLEAITEMNKAVAQDAAAVQSHTMSRDKLTVFVEPREMLNRLTTETQNLSQPTPLSSYDIPVQYLIMVAGFAGALWILFVIFRASRVRFRYEPATHTLTLPGGRRISATEIEEVDKRKWHKFFVTLRTKEGSPVQLDLLRYVPLEEWVLEMERHAPNYEPPEPEAEHVVTPAEAEYEPESETPADDVDAEEAGTRSA